MDFTTLFGLFYNKYRGEESPPTAGDPEWEIAVRNYNSALLRLEAYDGTKWEFARTTLQASTQLAPILDMTLTTGDTAFACPTDMRQPGGLWWVGNGTPRQVVSLKDIPMLSRSSLYGYFTGDQNSGFVFNLASPVVDADNGQALNYVYYKKLPRLVPATETGTSLIAGADPEYFACAMAAQRFLDSRNFPAYQIMKRDAEECLKQMKLANNSGDFYSHNLLEDTGPGWGDTSNSVKWGI